MRSYPLLRETDRLYDDSVADQSIQAVTKRSRRQIAAVNAGFDFPDAVLRTVVRIGCVTYIFRVPCRAKRGRRPESNELVVASFVSQEECPR